MKCGPGLATIAGMTQFASAFLSYLLMLPTRAKLLHECAQKIVSEESGIIPASASKLRNLPGIGPYTAGAISSIAYNAVEPIVGSYILSFAWYLLLIVLHRWQCGSSSRPHEGTQSEYEGI